MNIELPSVRRLEATHPALLLACIAIDGIVTREKTRVSIIDCGHHIPDGYEGQLEAHTVTFAVPQPHTAKLCSLITAALSTEYSISAEPGEITVSVILDRSLDSGRHE